MTIEVTTYEINDGVVSLFGVDCSEEHLQWLERGREDREVELEFQFDSHEIKDMTYLNNWIHRKSSAQKKAIDEAQPKTWGNALQCLSGHIVTLSGKYLVRE